MDTTLQVEWVPIQDVFCNPANPRLNDEAVEPVAASLKRFGWQQPIVVKESGEVIAGNTRLKAAKSLGMSEVPVVRFQGDDLEATAFGIADNRSHEFSRWDDGALVRLLQDLQDEDGLDAVGFSVEDIQRLIEELEADTPSDLDDPGPGDPPAVPISQTGDLWILGEHRLLCGDSTDLADVQRLMDGHQAALVATDPPYLVGYTGERPNDSGKDWTGSYREIDIKDAEGFFRSVFQNVLAVIAPHAAIYCWHAHKRTGVIQRVWEEIGILDHQQVIWIKPTSVFGRVFYHFRHEPCMMGWVQGSKPPHDDQHEYDSVWEIDWEGKSRIVGNEHPTQKPVEIFARPMRKHTRKGDVCFEPFSGSGSQMVAAQTLGRRCFAMEVSAPFVDVAIERWETATGGRAVLEGTEKTFEEIGRERRKEHR